MRYRFESRSEYEVALQKLLEERVTLTGDEQEKCDAEYDELLDEYVDFCVSEEDSGHLWN